MWSSLAATRVRLYAYTRPAFAVVGSTAAVAFDTFREQPAETRTSNAVGDHASQLAAVPSLVVGVAGVAAVASRLGRMSWLSHTYEAWAWGLSYGGLAFAAGAASLGCDDVTLLTPSACAAVAAIAGERLGSTVGRVLLPTLVAAGAASCGAALHGDERGARCAHALQASALVLLPALQLGCLPVYTLSLQGALACAWLWMAASATALDSAPPLAPSPEAARHALVAVGAASLLRTLVTRVPICHF